MTAEATDFIRRMMPLCAALEVEADRLDAERVVLSLLWRAELCTSGGLLHGGIIMALADSAGGACAYFNLPDGTGTATIESKTNFLGAVRDGTVVATAVPLHVGSTTIVIETDVTAGDRRVAKVIQTQAVLRR